MPILTFCEFCQNETTDCPHLAQERWEKSHPRSAPKLHFAKTAHEMRMDRIRGTSRYCEEHNSDILDCCVPKFKAEPRNAVREYMSAISEAYRPMPRTLSAWLAETDHWVSCVCGIRHEPPACAEPLDDL